MSDRLAKVEAFLESHDPENPSSHITYGESLALYNGVREEQLPDRVIIASQIIILGCRMCSAIYFGNPPGTAPDSHYYPS